MIIDVHAHIFPDKIAEKASKGISKFYDIKVDYDGKVSTLIKHCKESGIEKTVVHSAATIPEQVTVINDFIADSVKKQKDNLVGFMTLHPDFNDIQNEVDRAMSMSLKGVKIHPDFQRFNIDDPKAFKIYEAIEGKLPLLVHTGDFRYEFSKPQRMAKILDLFPRLDVIGAHFGGWSEWRDVAEVYAGKRIWVDTSSTMYRLPPIAIRSLIDAYGVDKVMFGSDYPMWNAKNELELLDKVNLSSTEKEMILHENAEKLLGI